MRSAKKIVPLFLLLLIFGSAESQPTIPDGFSWASTGPKGCKFLLPKGWHVKTEEVKGTYGVFITKEKLEKEKTFETGFTLNVIKEIKKKTGLVASQYALRFVYNVANEKEVVKELWSSESGSFQGTGIRIRDQFKIIHFLLNANDRTDTLFVSIFESTARKWESEWQIGRIIMTHMKLDSEI